MATAAHLLPLFAIAALAITMPVRAAFGATASGSSRASSSADHVKVELVSEATTLRPNSRAWFGLKFTHEPHWHTYWMNPGDSGLPTRIEWRLPKGYRAGEIVWPAPKRFDLGDLFNFGFDDTVLLMVPIDVPADAGRIESKKASIGMNARWLICNDVCIPGKASLSIDVPIAKVSPVPNPAHAAVFAKNRAAVPKTASARGVVAESGDRIRIELPAGELQDGAKGDVLDAFPTSAKLFTNAPFNISRNANTLILSGVRSEYFESAPATLSMVVTRRAAGGAASAAWRFDIPWSSVPRTSAPK
jgi:thiol:disulfide interchange protein DsbD